MNPPPPDGRYFVVKGRLWRCSNPALPEETRQLLVNDLMDARRKVKLAIRSEDLKELRDARQRVNPAKIALGERGPIWWDDGAPDLNRGSVSHSTYAQFKEPPNT